MVTKAIAFASALVLGSGLSTMISAAAQDPAAAQKCMICHAISGKGNKNNPLDGVGTKLSAAEIREWIVHPVEMAKKTGSTKKPPMPAKYSGLAPAEVDALVAYMQSLKK
jgi:mono/diheme cytochrome c family protein